MDTGADRKHRFLSDLIRDQVQTVLLPTSTPVTTIFDTSRFFQIWRTLVLRVRMFNGGSILLQNFINPVNVYILCTQGIDDYFTYCIVILILRSVLRVLLFSYEIMPLREISVVDQGTSGRQTEAGRQSTNRSIVQLLTVSMYCGGAAIAWDCAVTLSFWDDMLTSIRRQVLASCRTLAIPHLSSWAAWLALRCPYAKYILSCLVYNVIMYAFR